MAICPAVFVERMESETGPSNSATGGPEHPNTEACFLSSICSSKQSSESSNPSWCGVVAGEVGEESSDRCFVQVSFMAALKRQRQAGSGN